MQPAKTLDMCEHIMLSRLNGVRLFVMLLITVGYASTMPQGPEYAEIFNMFGYDPSWFGIQLLFFISGLLALRSVEKGRNGLTYLSSRCRRNIPLLTVITIGTFIILLPLFGTFEGNSLQLGVAFAKYLALTVTGIDPGIPFPGLFDNAQYTSLVQGGLWTLRYGVILHIGVAVAGRLGLLSSKYLIIASTLAAVLAYLLLTHVIAVKAISGLATPMTALRLSYAFLLGLSVWLCRGRLLQMGAKLWVLPLFFVAVASVNFMFDWSSVIEVSLTLAWMSLTFIALFIKLPITDTAEAWLKKCPNLTLIMLLINWPVCQVLLLMREGWTILPFIGYSTTLTLSLSYCVHSLFIRLGTYPHIRIFQAAKS